jgi:hypothetical protein
LLADERALVAAVELRMDFRGIRHELPRVLHVRVRKQCEVRRLFVSTVRILFGGAFAVVCRLPPMRRGVNVVVDGLMRGHARLLALGGHDELAAGSGPFLVTSFGGELLAI